MISRPEELTHYKRDIFSPRSPYENDVFLILTARTLSALFGQTRSYGGVAEIRYCDVVIIATMGRVTHLDKRRRAKFERSLFHPIPSHNHTPYAFSIRPSRSRCNRLAVILISGSFRSNVGREYLSGRRRKAKFTWRGWNARIWVVVHVNYILYVYIIRSSFMFRRRRTSQKPRVLVDFT